MTNIDIFSTLKEHFKELISLLGAIGMFFIGKKSRKIAEKKEMLSVHGAELENVETALKIYRGMLEDLHSKLTEAEKAYTLLEERWSASIKKNKAYEAEIFRLTKENEYLTNKLNN